MIRFLQTNLKRKRSAHDVAYATALREGIQVIIVGEPNKKLVRGNSGWVTDRRLDVGVFFVDKSIVVREVEARDGFVMVKLGERGCLIICCYISPNIPINSYKEKIGEISEAARRSAEEYVIVGDMNSKAIEWGSPTTNGRGAYLMEWVAQDNLHNDGRSPTCETTNGVSHVDLTLSSMRIARRICEWRTTEEVTLSDHRHIQFVLKGVKSKRDNKVERQAIKYDKGRIREKIRGGIEALKEQGRLSCRNITAEMKKAQEAGTITTGGGRKLPYWWNTEIAEARSVCILARRALVRARGTGDIDQNRENRKETLKTARRNLTKLIRTAKRNEWRALCGELENDIWGQGYKIATRHLRGTKMSYSITEEKRTEIVDSLFPHRRGGIWRRPYRAEIPPLFTLEELKEAAARLKNGKAPGEDGITAETVKLAVEEHAEVMLQLVNNLLRKQEFPSGWKLGKFILIPKGDKPQNNLTKYRPICLLNTVGKLYESLIRERLNNFLEEEGGLAENQYGFRKGRSTVAAAMRVKEAARVREKWCLLITLDIRNAFNTASWEKIITKLQDRNVPGYLINVVMDYFNERKIKVGKQLKDSTAGVPQGSVLGPTLWNVLYDDVLRLPLNRSTEIIGYADDLAMIIRAEDITELNRHIRDSVTQVIDWVEDNWLELAPEKTEAVVLKGPYKREKIIIEVQDVRIPLQRAVKYLGVLFDTQALYGKHVEQITKKADRKAAAMNRIMPNIGGPGWCKRRLLWGVVQSTVLYAAPVWHSALRVERYRQMLQSAQRKILLRVASAYRTVSSAAIQVITAVPPIELLVEERVQIMSEGGPDNKTAREETIRKWQERWDRETSVAQWTKRLIQDIGGWVRCKYKTINYWMTQFLTGHGSFRNFTERIGKHQGARCIYCDEEIDSPYHTIFECDRWHRERGDNWGEMNGQLTPDNIVGRMLESKGNWRSISSGVIRIMKRKETEERLYQAQERQQADE